MTDVHKQEQSKSWHETIGAPKIVGTFDERFMELYGHRPWAPSDGDRRAARALHIELISRIATQPLNYAEGVEQRALTSIVELFQRSRLITEAHADSTTFEVLAWHVLNEHVRPFTAHWHPRSVAGELRALDTSDVFRSELRAVQKALVDLDRVLEIIIEREGYRLVEPRERPDLAAIDDEMMRSVTWRPLGQAAADDPLAEQEKQAILARRATYGQNVNAPWASGLALSGGGIRSATFSLGVLIALARRNLLPQFDYLSTVSGGGYAGCFLTQLIAGSPQDQHHGLRATDRTFAREEGDPKILRQFRQNAAYLSGSLFERLGIAIAQAYGILTNALAIIVVAGAVACLDYLLRLSAGAVLIDWLSIQVPTLVATGLFCLPIVLAGWSRNDRFRTWIAVVLLLLGGWLLLGRLNDALTAVFAARGLDPQSALSGLLLIVALVLGGGIALARLTNARPFLLACLAVGLFILAEVVLFMLLVSLGDRWFWLAITGIIAAFVLHATLDINKTALHGYYRRKLAAAFLLEGGGKAAKPAKLSQLKLERALFPIINCSLNAPGSTNASLGGRRSDLFSLTPVSAGAPFALGGQAQSMKSWEDANPGLDIATAMALSGAAISPQMGLRTHVGTSFWLTLLNLRLSQWLNKPGPRRAPGLFQLMQEMLATADERGPMINVSDGGHIENLGVYELLRRRCRFIVAVDGEHDPAMTFHAIANLQRLAYIDLGITIEMDLNDLRLNSLGLSRSHFHFCRINYPGAEAPEVGYLIYLKLSLTGNEGELIRRFKTDEPTFPHHTTADQFFTETRFEAYRALGEHVGDKLFLPAIIGALPNKLTLEDWYLRLGRSLLQPSVAAH